MNIKTSAYTYRRTSLRKNQSYFVYLNVINKYIINLLAEAMNTEQ